MTYINQQIAQEIVDTIKDISGRNINFINKNGMIIASTNTSRINTFHEIGHQVAITGNTMEVSDDTSYSGTQKGINIPITYNGNVIAAIGISGELEEVRKYAYLAQKITSILLKERELDMLGVQKKNRLNYIIRSLIHNEPIQQTYLKKTIQSFNFNEDTPCRAVLIHLNAKYNPSNLFMIQDKITSVIEALGAQLYTYNYPNEYIILLPAEDLLQQHYLLEYLVETYAPILSISIGKKTTFSDISESYKCALLAMNSTPNTHGLVHYDALDYELIIGNVPETIKEQYLQKTIVRLNETELEILQTYFEEGMSLQKTSDKLFMHKNSLQYKLNHIASTCGYNPRDFKDAVILYTALKLYL